MRVKLISYIMLFVVIMIYCNNKVIKFNYPSNQIIMEINAVSPNGRYAIINILEDSIGDLKIQYIKPMTQPPLVKTQIVLDFEEQNWWQLIDYPLVDTTQLYNAYYFAWSDNSKKVLFSVAFTYPKDTLEFFPLYLCHLEKRKSSNLNVPYSSTTFYRIPLFSQRKSEIIFWSSGVVIDTIQLSYTSIGRIFKWDTLQKSLTEIKTGKDITSVHWMGQCDSTSLFMNINRILNCFSLSTSEIEKVLPKIQIRGLIKVFGEKIVFIGRHQGIKKNIYVYNMATKNLELTLDDVGEHALNVDMNRNYRFALKTAVSDTHYISVISREGEKIASFKGISPYWLAGSDTLIYSVGKQIVKAWLDENQQLHKKVVLQHVKQ